MSVLFAHLEEFKTQVYKEATKAERERSRDKESCANDFVVNLGIKMKCVYTKDLDHCRWRQTTTTTTTAKETARLPSNISCSWRRWQIVTENCVPHCAVCLLSSFFVVITVCNAVYTHRVIYYESNHINFHRVFFLRVKRGFPTNRLWLYVAVVLCLLRKEYISIHKYKWVRTHLRNSFWFFFNSIDGMYAMDSDSIHQIMIK